MGKYPADFKADLRHPVSYSGLEEANWFQWRTPTMIELSVMETYQFIKGTLKRPKQKIVDVGCGNGYAALELAREGHSVTGIDPSEEAIEIATKTAAENPDQDKLGELDYIHAEFAQWQGTEASFDAVIFNLSLHHIPDLPQVMEQVRHLLKKGGLLICNDYAYDRLDPKTAQWVYQTQQLLFLSGLYRNLGDAPTSEALREAWLERSAHHSLHPFETMISLLKTNFHEQFFSWVPYLFVYIGNGIRQASPKTEQKLLTFIKSIEKEQIERGYIQAVGFRYVGVR